MPRASKEEGEVVKKRAPRRQVASRAPRKTTTTRTRAAAPVTAPRESSEEEVVPAPRRKAPTKLPLSPASPVALYEASRAKKSLYVSGSLLLLGLAIAAGVGYSDKGVINTAAIVAERNAQLAAGVTSTDGGVGTVYVPVQNSAAGQIDGGLVSSGEVPALIPAASEVATTTASSTEMASSTDAAAASSTDSPSEGVPSEATEEAAPTAVDAASSTE